MPELRRDELSGRWVLLAPNRAARPFTFPEQTAPARRSPADCPFCPGHEHMTPPEVYRRGPGAPQAPGWRVRVVPNLYPIVGGPDASPGATGVHEVVVLSPEHDRSFARLDDDQALEALEVVRDRVRLHLAQGRAHVQALINHGRAAGASIEHPHAQVIAIDVLPPAVEAELGRLAAAGADLVAEAMRRLHDDDRYAISLGSASAWCPEASATPYELRFAHERPRARFDEAGDDEVAQVAIATRDALRRLLGAIGDVPYNLVVHTAPPALRASFFHWYVEVQPRVTVVAGFEQGTGILVNVTPPELAARQLREVPLD